MLLAFIYATHGQGGWRWEEGGRGEDALSSDAPHWSGFHSTPLFQSADDGGEPLLVVLSDIVLAGIVELMQVCRTSRAGPVLCTFTEARRRWPGLAEARDAQEQWRLLERRLRDGGVALTAREGIASHRIA